MSSLGSSNNAILFNGCQSLINLQVSLQVTKDLITLNNVGFSLQLNCYPQPTPTVNGKPLTWMQYWIAVDNNSGFRGGIQYFSAVSGFGFSPGPPDWQPFGSATSNQVPAGSLMGIKLATNTNGNVTNVVFSNTDPEGNYSNYSFSFPPNALAALYGFQVNLVGPPGGTCTFSSGAGTLTYKVSSGKLAVQTTNTCKIAVKTKSGFSVIKGGVQLQTGETSNAVYGNVTPASSPTVSQNLHVPAWTWEAQGAPPGTAGTKAINSPGVVYQPTLDRLQVFVVGSDGNLYDKYYNGTNWVWEAQGAPPGTAGTKAINSPGVVYQPTLDRIQVFVVGSDGNLYDKYHNGTNWVWEAQGAPAPPGAAGAKATNSPGVVYQPTLDRIQVFVVGSDGNLYDKYYSA